MSQQDVQPEGEIQSPDVICSPTEVQIKSLKKNRQSIQQLLLSFEDNNLYEQQLQQEQDLFKEIKRRMLKTNLSDRRALGGVLGTAILGIVGLAVGLNVIGLIIGGILGAFLGTYAGRRIKENAMKKKKLMNINLYVIKFAAYVQHLIDIPLQTAELQTLRLIMLLLVSDCKMVILYSHKFQKQEKRQVVKIQKKLVKYLKKEKCLYSCLELYWIVKRWIKTNERYSELSVEQREFVEKEIARITFSFLRPLSKLMTANRKMLNNKQKSFEGKINQLLLCPQVLNLHEKYVQQHHQLHLQEEAEQEFLENIYKEVELKQLKEMMEDQIAQDILKEDQIEIQKKQNQEQQHNENGKSSLSNSKNQQQIIEQVASPQISQLIKEGGGNVSSNNNQLESMKYVVWNHSQNTSSIHNNTANPNQFQSFNNKSRLIDLIHLASQQKQQEEEFASNASQKLAHEHFQSQQGRQAYLNNTQPRKLFFEKMAQDNKGGISLNKENKGLESETQQNEKENFQVFTLNNNQSDDMLKDLDNSNVKNEKKNYRVHNHKNLALLDQQYEQILKDQNKPQQKNNDGYIPQKFLSNNGIDDQQFNSGTYSSHQDVSQQQQQNIESNNNQEKIHKEQTLAIPLNSLNNIKNLSSSHIQQAVPSLQDHSHEQKFESVNNDPANYQTYVEDVNKTIKKTAQIVYQQKYKGSRNLQQMGKLGRSSYANMPQVQNEEEFQAAIEELKFDNQMLNQNQDKRLKHFISQNNYVGNKDASPSQSFVRNKRGDIFLKMNSFDSIMTNENYGRSSNVNNNNKGEHNEQVVIEFQDGNQNQDIKGTGNDIIIENQPNNIDLEMLQKPTTGLEHGEQHKSTFFEGNKHDIVQNRESLKSQHQRDSMQSNNVQLIVENQSQKNSDSSFTQNKNKSQDQNEVQIIAEQTPIKDQQKQPSKRLESSPHQQRTSLSGQKSVSGKQQDNVNHFRNSIHEDIENTGFYAKDDQEQVDRVVISMLTSSQVMKKNANSQIEKKTDPEIEQKLIKLKELDDENPEKAWEKVINKDRISIYKKTIPKNPSVMVRAEAFISECSSEEVFEQIYYENYRKKWDKVTLGFSVIEDLGDQQDVIYFYIDPGFGVTKRDFLQKRAVRRDYPSKGEITIVFFSTTHPSMPEIKGTIRAISHIAAYIIRPVKEGGNNCHLTIITQSDVKGQIPKYIVNFLAARAPAKWIESMKKGVFDHRKALKKK